VIISETIGLWGIDEKIHKILPDARKRFLKKGGKIIPEWLELWVVPVEFNYFWNQSFDFWDKELFGLDFKPVRDCALMRRHSHDTQGKVKYLAKPSQVHRFNFYKSGDAPFRYPGKFKVDKAGHLHGFLCYFKAGLAKDVVLSTSPDKPSTHWKQTFYPVKKAVRIREGDVIQSEIRYIAPHGFSYWEWQTDVERKGGKIASFLQSDFDPSKKDMLIARTNFKPVLQKHAMLNRRILNLCDGKRSVPKIARIVRKEFPGRYRNLDEAQSSVLAYLRGWIKS